MTRLTLDIPSDKLDFFLALLKELGIEPSNHQDIPEWQKTEVKNRILNEDSEKYITYKKARENFKK